MFDRTRKDTARWSEEKINTCQRLLEVDTQITVIQKNYKDEVGIFTAEEKHKSKGGVACREVSYIKSSFKQED